MTDTPTNNKPSPKPSDKLAKDAITSLTTAQLALYAGWTMAVLYAAVPEPPPELGPAKLPTVHELSETQRRKVEAGRLHRLFDRLAEVLESTELKKASEGLQAEDGEFSAHLLEFHLTVLGVLAAAGLQLELAYELGRSLRDTVDPRADPGDSAHKDAPLAAAVGRQLARGRIAKLQEWLATLAAEFPPQVAAIVSASLGRWSDFADVTVGPSAASSQDPTSKNDFAKDMRDYLLRQGDVWLMLLVGAQSTSGLLTPEGYVAAGEAALRRSAKIIRSVLVHHWVAIVVLAAALGGVMYLAITQLGGASKVWTSIAAIGSTLGLSAQSVKSAISRLSSEAERPVLAAAEEDAKAWSVTTLPQAKANLTIMAKRKLRQSGVTPPAGLGRF